jgi:hypothetical protein
MVQMKFTSFFVAATVVFFSFGANAVTMENCIDVDEQVEQASILEKYCSNFKGAFNTLYRFKKDIGCLTVTFGSAYMNDPRGIASRKRIDAVAASERQLSNKLTSKAYCEARKADYNEIQVYANQLAAEFNASKSKGPRPTPYLLYSNITGEMQPTGEHPDKETCLKKGTDGVAYFRAKLEANGFPNRAAKLAFKCESLDQ